MIQVLQQPQLINESLLKLQTADDWMKRSIKSHTIPRFRRDSIILSGTTSAMLLLVKGQAYC